MILTTLDGVAAGDFADHTGWTPKPEGLCQGDVCVPAPGSLHLDGTVDITIAAERLGMPLVRDDVHGLTRGRAGDAATARPWPRRRPPTLR